MFDRIRGVLSQASRIVILAHDYPDGDAVGSALAMHELLRNMGKDVHVFLSNVRQESWSFLGFFPVINTVEELLSQSFDVAVVVDSSHEKRLGNAVELLQKIPMVINIDHHTDNSGFGHLNYVREAAAVGEILYEYMLESGVSITRNIAVALLVSLITDTGRFKHNNTHRGIFGMVHELLGYVQPQDYRQIITQLYEEEPLSKMQLVGESLRNMVLLHSTIAFSFLDQDCGLEEGLIDPLLSIQGAKVAVLLRLAGQQIRMSFRSKDTQISVRELAAQFGGGGHPQASGATIPLVSFREQVKEIEAKVAQHFEPLRAQEHG